MYIEDHQFPYPHHPLAPDEPGDGLVVDDEVTAAVFQLRPLNVDACAAWCGGTQLLVNGGPAVLVGGGVAGLGDYVVLVHGEYRVEPAAGFGQRWSPVGADAGS